LQGAQKKEGVSYEEIGEIMGLKSGPDMLLEIGRLLGEINEDEHNNGRPMLSAVAVEPSSKMPGEGFFNFAKQLNKFEGETDQEKREFWRDEIQRVYDIW
jgi:hypothetical protein